MVGCYTRHLNLRLSRSGRGSARNILTPNRQCLHSKKVTDILRREGRPYIQPTYVSGYYYYYYLLRMFIFLLHEPYSLWAFVFQNLKTPFFLKLFGSDTFPLGSPVVRGPPPAPRTEGERCRVEKRPALPRHVQTLSQELRQVHIS